MNKNLSDKSAPLGDFSHAKIAVVVSEYHHDITFALRDACITTLIENGVPQENIKLVMAPGAYEMPIAALLADADHRDAVICLGCVIKGDTDHDVYINQAVANGLMKLSLERAKPFVFGLLTTNNHQQALDRAGGKHGNKGTECAIAALKILALKPTT